MSRTMTALRKPLAAALVGCTLLSLAACGGGGSKATSSTTAAAASGTGVLAPTTSAAPSSTPAGGGAATTPPASTSGKVNANSASQADLATAFQAVGVPNADRWAKEVDEYKPYTNDPNWAKLRQELGKYNIASDTLAKILSVLEV